MFSVRVGSGGRTRTSGLRVMSPTSYRLLYPAMLECKYTDYSGICKIYLKKRIDALALRQAQRPSVRFGKLGGQGVRFGRLGGQVYDSAGSAAKCTLRQAQRPDGDRSCFSQSEMFMNSFIPAMSALAKDFCSPVARFFSWTVPASASSPPLMDRNGMDFFSA